MQSVALQRESLQLSVQIQRDTMHAVQENRTKERREKENSQAIDAATKYKGWQYQLSYHLPRNVTYDKFHEGLCRLHAESVAADNERSFLNRLLEYNDTVALYVNENARHSSYKFDEVADMILSRSRPKQAEVEQLLTDWDPIKALAKHSGPDKFAFLATQLTILTKQARNQTPTPRIFLAWIRPILKDNFRLAEVMVGGFQKKTGDDLPGFVDYLEANFSAPKEVAPRDEPQTSGPVPMDIGMILEEHQNALLSSREACLELEMGKQNVLWCFLCKTHTNHKTADCPKHGNNKAADHEKKRGKGPKGQARVVTVQVISQIFNQT
jgi:hypothetical protein